MNFEPYEVAFVTWPGVTTAAVDRIENQLWTAKTNGHPSFEEVTVERNEDSTIRVTLTTEASDPFDAYDFARSIMETELHRHSPAVFQDDQEGTWCASLEVRHFEAAHAL